MTSVRTPNASRELRQSQPTRPATVRHYQTSNRARSTTVGNGIQLIHEALSRARMRRPQTHSEAYRSARQITINARRETNRWLGQ
jgi:hypothetical protein